MESGKMKVLLGDDSCAVRQFIKVVLGNQGAPEVTEAQDGIVTSMGREEDRDAGLTLGADTYVTIPVNGMGLIDAVSRLIG